MFIREDDRGFNVFDFDCPHCQTTGEVGIPKDKAGLVRHDCGVLIKHDPGGLLRRPSISVFVQGTIPCYGQMQAIREANRD